MTDRLDRMGIEFAEGHDAENVGDAHVVVRSTAVREDNPEISRSASPFNSSDSASGDAC